ncbi:RagB/SusD family nutrient uptake outer membrane protein [Aestuariibaculum sp. M13]|uniref:RagB/SusD family nutrient uptake outer membrane protein n=1 Tax=Aestuariibaculum sp. M13 TaxID=2967132 RepID=UPI002159C9B9|nr:RagB/SusD family nutrient uptake outer membrane protein [Aestuariibaculum sp. M13]MCR8668918.1 RagB/SusD family nutrient uptake outer membrane protein [Aestuariibaculum sp. M13]
MKNSIKNNIIKIIGVVFIGITSSSCSDYLDVTPEDKILESQLYATEGGIQNQLNGVYHRITSEPLYGGRLTMGVMELLAQRYTIARSDSDYAPFVGYNYSNEDLRSSFDGIWTNAYVSILNLNDLITNVDKYGVLNPEKSNIIKGEAYGLRAMLHFDLLRIFGPIYSENPESSAIPYYSEAKAENGEILSAKAVMELVLKDLDMAESLLENDPILGNSSITDGYYLNNRKLHLNYFGVKALQARVNLYAGNIETAKTAAKFVIDEASSIYPWTSPSAITSAGGNPDRSFSPEVIFGPQNVNLYNRYDNMFSGELRANDVLYYNESRLDQMFESNESDYRYNYIWIKPTEGGEITFRTFHKFADVAEPDMPFRYMQPLIRKTEMYYILAEAETDEITALEYLNTVRYNRGLVNAESGVDIQAEIEKEYMREFFGEGQLFFYYKRRNIEKIPNAKSTSSRSFITMSPEKYVLPLPDSELKYQ